MEIGGGGWEYRLQVCSFSRSQAQGVTLVVKVSAEGLLKGVDYRFVLSPGLKLKVSHQASKGISGEATEGILFFISFFRPVGF